MAPAYSLGNKPLAALALERNVTLDVVRGVRWPSGMVVHGPLVEMSTLGRQGAASKIVDFWYETFVRMPENVLNGKPYYGAWKRRAEKAYYGLAKDTGAAIDDGLKAAIDQASRKFALGQTKRIMFDFSQSTRLGELIYGVAPFLQPFMEAFQVYGHILMSRNPAMAGQIARLWTRGSRPGSCAVTRRAGSGPSRRRGTRAAEPSSGCSAMSRVCR